MVKSTLARTIYSSRIPTVSAVGHETDFTIADFVADCRMPTPSAAAELVSKDQADLIHQIQQIAALYILVLAMQLVLLVAMFLSL